MARDDADRQRIWKGRKSAFSAVGRLSPDYIVQDGVVPRGRLAETLTEIERLSKVYDTPVANVFHAGDGNLHPLILYDGRRDGGLGTGREIGGRDPRIVYPRRWIDHRRARHRRGEARLPSENVRGGRRGSDVESTFGHRSTSRSPTAARCSRVADPVSRPALARTLWSVPVSSRASDDAEPHMLQPMTPQTPLTSYRRWCTVTSESSLRGGRTKSALSTPLDGAKTLDLSKLCRAWWSTIPANTPLRLWQERPSPRSNLELDAHGQYLPFDPPFAAERCDPRWDRGLGTERAGSLPLRWCSRLHPRSEPGGRHRSAGAGWGKVVKNAAGFDIPKLIVGSLGELGVLVELTFKVFPKAESQLTVEYRSHQARRRDGSALSRLYLATRHVVARPCTACGWIVEPLGSDWRSRR